MRSNINKMYLINLLKNMMFFSAVAVPFFLDWAKVDYTRIFLLEAIFSFSMFILEIPTGVIADKYGRKYSLALGGFFSAVSFLMFGFFKSYLVYFLAEVICAVGFTLLSGADKALLYDTLIALQEEDKASRYFSRYESIGLIGIIIGLAGGSWLAGSKILAYPASLPLTFNITGIVLMTVIPVALSLKEPQSRSTGEKFIQQGIGGFKHIFLNNRLRGFTLNYALISAMTFFMYWLYQSWLRSAGVNLSYYGVVGTAFNLFGILLMLNLGKIEKVFGVNRLLLITALLPGLLYVGLFYTNNLIYGLLAILFITGLRQLRSPLLSDFINQHINSENRATVLSGVSMLERVVTMIMYPITGLLVDYSLAIAFLFLGITTVVFSFLTKIKVVKVDYGE